jgi:4-hydroxybenzoate polyprenyltransferase
MAEDSPSPAAAPAAIPPGEGGLAPASLGAPAARAEQRAPAARALLEAMRPRQWMKNVFVLAGMVFDGRLFDPASIGRAMVCFAVFCAASSAVYLVNDVADRTADMNHPLKRRRAIASGRLRPFPALLAAAGLTGLAVAGAGALSRGTLAVLLLYLLLSAAYSAGLKRVFIVDVMVVATGFVLRAAAGAAAVFAQISPWLLCCSFLLALFLSLGKRRHELALLGDGAGTHRRALSSYSLPLLDGWLTALSAATIVCYAIYTQAPRTVSHFGTTSMVYTVPFVVYALFRYQHLVLREGAGGDPGSSLLHDRALMIAIAGWAAAAAFIIYAD